MLKILKEFAILVFSLVEFLLAIRFVLKLFGASSASTFVAFVYENTEPLLRPFFFAFPTPSVSGRFVLEFTTIFALFVYAFLAFLIQELLEIFDRSEKRR